MGRDEVWILPAFLIAAATAFVALTLSAITGYPARPNGGTSFQAAVAVITVTAFLRFVRHLVQLWKADVEHPIKRILDDARPAAINFIPLLVGFTIIAVFFVSLTFLKSMIPVVVPFWSDPLFAAIDQAIAVDPQKLAVSLHPMLDALGYFYALWHLVHIGGILWVLHWRSGDRGRHILSFMLTWSIGMALAYAFSSAGPIFAGSYDPSVAPATVRRAAEFLWANYESQGAAIGGGISAFPSMHVAIATWFAIALSDRGFRIIGQAYLLAIFFCSIILGWHYVADGVAGIGIAILADRLSGLWIRRANIQQGIATATATGASTA